MHGSPSTAYPDYDAEECVKRGRAKRMRPGAPAVVHPGGGRAISLVAACFALLLTLACVVPLVLWGNLYPAGVGRYWGWGSVGIALVMGLASVIDANFVREFPRRCSDALTKPSRLTFAVVVATTATLLAATFASYAFRRSATTSDEIAQLWQAKILLHGRLSLPPDPNPEFFALENVIDSGRWYSQFPIGGPLFLTLGTAMGVPWIVNPVAVGVATVAFFWFARGAYGEAQGRAAAALFSVTPMILLMAGTLMNHVPVLFLTTIALAALFEWERSTTMRRAVTSGAVIGLSLGILTTVRPLDGVIVAGSIGLFQLWRIRKDWRRVRELAVQAILGAVGVAPLLYANAATTGHPLRFGYAVMWGPGHQIGFRVDPYGNVHTLGRALEYAMTYVSELNMSLMAWPVPALAFVTLTLLATRRVSRWDVLLIGLFVAQVAAYASYSLVGEFLGPRFLYTALPTLVVLVARMPFIVRERLGPTWQRTSLAGILVCLLVSWSNPALPFSVWGLAKQARNTRRALKADIAGTVRAAQLHNALVFLREPLGGRLLRRLWGIGVSRSDAAQLLARADACSLLSAINGAESDTSIPRALKPQAIFRSTAMFVSGEQSIEGGDPPVRLSSPASLTPPCRAELEADERLGGLPFGPALPLEPIGPSGRLEGDVIYAADLGEHNEALRKRFGDRTWYRLVLARAADGSPRLTITAY